jgi:hypothetical protein
MKRIYLAIPYTGMEEASFEIATRLTAKFLNEGLNIFSPITHSHPLKRYNLPGDWGFWSEVDYQFIEHFAEELIIVVPANGGMDSIMKSIGVQAEIEFAKKLHKPITYYIESTDNLIPYNYETK